MLSYHFVRTEVLSLEHGSTFSNLFDKRHSGDYEDFAYCDAALVDYLRPRAEAFIKSVESLAQESMDRSQTKTNIFFLPFHRLHPAITLSPRGGNAMQNNKQKRKT